MATSYYELLRDPRWQRKRLEVMEAARFECENCEVREKTLNVHHRFYKKNAKPWEYSRGELACLCEDCHTQRHAHLDAAKVLAGMLDQGSLEIAHGYLLGTYLSTNASPDFDAVAVATLSYEFAVGLADAYGIRGNESIDAILRECDRTGEARHSFLWQLRTEQHEARVA